MEKSWIVYGPQGTGKTLHASAICKALGLDPKRTIDEWDGRQCSFKPAGTLHLTTHLPAWAEGSRRALSIEQALARVPGLAAPPRCPRCRPPRSLGTTSRTPRPSPPTPTAASRC